MQEFFGDAKFFSLNFSAVNVFGHAQHNSVSTICSCLALEKI